MPVITTTTTNSTNLTITGAMSMMISSIRHFAWSLFNRFRASARAFLRSRDGGGMMATLLFVLTAMAGTGALMTNYAWREAQWEALQAAVRAATASAGELLSAGDNQATEERIRQFIEAVVADMEGVTVRVTTDPTTRVITVAVTGDLDFDELWVPEDADPELVALSTRVILDVDRYEFALALDITHSMTANMPLAGNLSRLEALKAAVGAAIDVTADLRSTHPSSIMVSVVPYGSAVNAADTCNPHPVSGVCRSARSDAKERYVRMLSGRDDSGNALWDGAVLAGGHWVDTFHHYGSGQALWPWSAQTPPLPNPWQALPLPAHGFSPYFGQSQRWDLRRTNATLAIIDRANRVPWNVDYKDFWNGCLMARWGAYWNPAARPTSYVPGDAGNWPATSEGEKWSAGAITGLPADTPLHLSDVPPSAAAPSTLFTAYSWPDARVAGNADHILQSVMFSLLDTPTTVLPFDQRVRQRSLDTAPRVGDNDWSITGDGRGAALCPESPLIPLSDDMVALRAAVNALQTVPQIPGTGGTRGMTMGHLGVVWALRSLSPLWQDIWDVADTTGVSRPAIPCAAGEISAVCDAKNHKTILIVSDGANNMTVVGNRMMSASSGSNPDPQNSGVLGRSCYDLATDYPSYHAALEATTETEFNLQFAAYTGAGDRFASGSRMDPVLDAFNRYIDRDPLDPFNFEPEPVGSRGVRANVLRQVTPWGIFRGIDNGDIDRLLNTPEFDSATRPFRSGRPVQLRHLCHLSSPFTPYGRVDDAVREGEFGSTAPQPVWGVAPFSLPAGIPSQGVNHTTAETQVNNWMIGKLDTWLTEACRIAGARGVGVKAIYINDQADRGLTALNNCITAAGGDPATDVYVTTSADALRSTFEDLFSVTRNLRFLD